MKKKFIVAAGLALIPAIIMAQKTSHAIKADALIKKNDFLLESHLLTFSQMDQRKIYHWDNGQASTPTGRQAGEVTPKYVRVFGDSAAVVWHPFKKPARTLNRSPW